MSSYARGETPNPRRSELDGDRVVKGFCSDVTISCIELANAIFEYLEIWHDRRLGHSALGWVSPLEFENRSTIVVA